jgi:UDP-N-acetylglucosamine acyltransferase
MTKVHGTALVDLGADIDDDVEIGAFAVIGSKVRIGAGSKIGAHVVIAGDTVLGRDNTVSPFCCLGGPPQDKKFAGEETRLVIGDRNTIREYCFFNPGTVQDLGVTTIGDDNWIMGYVHVAHDCVIGNQTVIANATQLAGHVQLGDYAILGGLTGVHQFVKIGAHVMGGAHSYLSQDVPPYVLCSGAPAVPHGVNTEGLKRRGFDETAIAAVKQVYRLLYRQKLSFEDARAAILEFAKTTEPNAKAAVTVFADFLANATRGVIR